MSSITGLRHGDVVQCRLVSFSERSPRLHKSLVFPRVPMYGEPLGPTSGVICVSPGHTCSRTSVHREQQRLFASTCLDGVQEHVKRNTLSAKLRAKMAEVPSYLVLRAPEVWAVTLFNKECHLFATAAGGIKSLAAAIGAISSSPKHRSPIVPC